MTTPDSVKFHQPREEDWVQLEPLVASALGPSWSESSLEDLAKSGQGLLWVSSDPEGVVLGIAVFRLVVDEAELLLVAVREESREQGIGTRLLRTVLQEDFLKNVRVIHLEVNEHNAAARSLYQKLGFSVVGRRTGYYPGGEDALLMSWVNPARKS